MYSVILMAALTTNTAEAPAFHKHGGSCYGGIGLHSGRYGACMGCWGAGCNGGYGGGACYGCMGYGGGYGLPYGGWYGYGAPAPYTPSANPMAVPPPVGTTPMPPVPPAVVPEKPPVSPSARLGSYGGTPAKLVIEKPVDAKLFVDNIPVAAEAASKTFTTPELDPAMAYYYMVRIEMTREGKPVSETRRVIVRAGETATETFREPTGLTTASK
jgi:uncharacterized protein (TIGR03000 family)